jgi:hypothetical protein
MVPWTNEELKMRKITTLAALGLASFAFAATPAMACDCAPESVEAWDVLTGGDTHYFWVYADAGEVMFIDLYGDGSADIDVIVTDEDGYIVAEGTSFEAWEEIEWMARHEGTFYVEVTSLAASGETEYELSVY